MKLFNIDEIIETANLKKEKYKSKLGFTSEQARIAYAVAAGTLPSYTIEGFSKNEIVITMLKRSILHNIFGKDLDMETLQKFLNCSLVVNKISLAENYYGKYVFQEHIYEDDIGMCNNHDTYVVCDYTNENFIDVYHINPALWCFNMIKLREEEWQEKFPELLGEVIAMDKNQN